jgi:hypothetical protein
MRSRQLSMVVSITLPPRSLFDRQPAFSNVARWEEAGFTSGQKLNIVVAFSVRRTYAERLVSEGKQPGLGLKSPSTFWFS